MFKDLIDATIQFRTCEDVRPLLERACKTNADIAAYGSLGESEEGRSIDSVILGNGDRRISLIAGAHSDEPVGPETLRMFVLNSLAQRDRFEDLFSRYRFVIVPHVNPDGEAGNQAWIREWPSLETYVKHVLREPPGRDVEFGFPGMRIENRVVSQFLAGYAPYKLHMSLHGMSCSDGALLLIERHWIDRTQTLREQYSAEVLDAGLRLHDHDRKGDKGFIYIAPGYTTTPEGSAMRAYFEANDDLETAALFHDSSMEFVRRCGGDPLCMVTEMPLFLIKKQDPDPRPGMPRVFMEFRKRIPELRLMVTRNEPISHILEDFQIEPLDLRLTVRLQLHALALGLQIFK